MNRKSFLLVGVFVLLLSLLMTHAFAADTTQSNTTVATTDTTQQLWPQYPKTNYGTGAQADIVKQGEYLVKAGDCIACHTDKANGKLFAGGLPIKTPFGTMYTPNITPDKKTGIGNWTDAQFINALRHGIAPNGSYYFPAFPYVYYNRLSDKDALAIKAYLNTLPPVEQENKPLDMPIPFRWRFLQFFWRVMFFDFNKGEYQVDSHQPADWNRGRFLVMSLGHCGMCHTPLNFLGAEKKEYFLAGGSGSGFFAPNITSAALGNIPTQDVIAVFLQDKYVGGGKIVGPMLEVNHDSLSYLSKDDLTAIATYLKTVKSKEPPKPKTGGGPGENIYSNYCSGCHSTGAGGAPKMGDQAAWAPLIKLGMDQLYKNATNGIGGMPPKGTCSSCSDKEIQAAVNYIVNHSQAGAGGAAAPAQITAADLTSLTKGKEIYDKVCSACHADGQLNAPIIGDKQAWAPRIDEGMDVLFAHSLAGYKSMPPKGACEKCTDADVMAAVKYMVEKSKTSGNYNLW
jgi:cytochrome c5